MSSLNDILGPDVDEQDNMKQKPIIPIHSSTHSRTHSSTQGTKKPCPKQTETLDTTNIDNILNNDLLKFDNKYQTSMFFVCYKAMEIFCKDFNKKYNKPGSGSGSGMSIPKEFIESHILNTLPFIIKDYTGNLKKRSKKIINPETLCLGRKLDNKQCTRKKHNDSEFCRSHLIKLSNGRIDQPNKSIVHSKRGRKRKVVFDPRQYDNEYITLWEDIINGEKVLIDSNSNIYTFDLVNPQYIGKKHINNKLDIAGIIKNILDKKKEINQSIVLLPILDTDNTILENTILENTILENTILDIDNHKIDSNNIMNTIKEQPRIQKSNTKKQSIINRD